ncbi:unnamed protein product [Ectocarpus sp. 13 AM-2016]
MKCYKVPLQGFRLVSFSTMSNNDGQAPLSPAFFRWAPPKPK